ncbi:hypothetical protein E2320_018282 [Naja naja]|nr:hypothetical protein E2320_018282 [Naja naja]
MDLRLRDLRLQEEREFLESVALPQPVNSEHTPGPMNESPLDQSPMEEARRGSRGKVIVPEPLITDADWQMPCVPKSPRDASLILEAVKRNEFLRCLGDGQSQTLVDSFISEQRQPGDIVVAEGDEGHAMYIVAEGELGVTQKGRHLRRLLPGDVFGELAVLYNCQRTATVMGKAGIVMCICLSKFSAAIVSSEFYQLCLSSSKESQQPVSTNCYLS